MSILLKDGRRISESLNRNRSQLACAVGAIITFIAPFGCNDGSTPEEHSTSRSALNIGDSFTDDAFRTAAVCPGCAVVNKRELSLPLTGVVAASAELFDGQRRYRSTLLASGVAADEGSLLRNEQEAHIAKSGKLTPDLHSRLHPQSQTPATPAITVAIWEKVADLRPNRDNPGEVSTSRDAITAQLTNSSIAILNKLAALGATVGTTGTTSPLIVATLPALSVEGLAALPEVAAIGIADPPVPTGPVWYNTIGSDVAHVYGTGTGVNICNNEGNSQPDSVGLLNVTGIRTTSGPPSAHMRWTSGIMKNIDNPIDSVAPDANMYIDDDDGTHFYYAVGDWCSQIGARFVEECRPEHQPAGTIRLVGLVLGLDGASTAVSTRGLGRWKHRTGCRPGHSRESWIQRTRRRF